VDGGKKIRQHNASAMNEKPDSISEVINRNRGEGRAKHGKTRGRVEDKGGIKKSF